MNCFLYTYVYEIGINVKRLPVQAAFEIIILIKYAGIVFSVLKVYCFIILSDQFSSFTFTIKR